MQYTYKEEFIRFMVSNGVLKFGEFTLKSGRIAPYFINTGNYKTGKQLAKLGVPITAEDTGLDYGRTIKFNSEDGSLLVMSSLKGNKTI